MKIHFKIFILFILLFLVFIISFLLALYKNKEYVKKSIEKDEAESIVSLMLAFRQSYQDVFLENQIEIDDTTINLIAAKNTERISEKFSEKMGYKIIIRTVSDIARNPSNKANEKEMEIISFFKKNPNKKSFLKKYEHGSLYAIPLYITKKCLQCHGSIDKVPNAIKERYNNAYNYKIGDLRGIISIKTTRDKIGNIADASFKKVLLFSILIFIVIIAIIFFLIKKLLKNENDFTEKLQKEVEAKTKELKISNKKLININIELIDINKNYYKQNNELAKSKKELKQNIEELTITKEELEEKNKIILKREADLLDKKNEILAINEEYYKQNIEYSKLIKKHILLNENLQQQNRILEIAEYKAQEANKFKSIFLANMSHEIRTPMNAILGFSEILQSRILDNENKKIISNIITSGNVLINLINDILDLSKIEAGELRILKENINLHKLINNVPMIFSDLSKKKGIPIEITIGKDVPEFILIDGLRLNQIFINLVGNALKFTHNGNIRINTKLIKKTKKLADISINVHDTGIGIPTEQLHTIFDTFRQVEGQSTRKYGGTGLGLAITKKLVRLLGGKIHVKSKVGEGTTFSVILKNIEILQKENLKPDVIFENILKEEKIKILHVEDNDMNRQIISFFAEEYKFELVEVVNGQEAIDVLKTYKPDIILMDIQMPVLDGYEATKIIKANKKIRNIPILALTANATSEDKKKYNHVFDEYITKPVSKDKFIKTISKFVKLVN